ncbi:TPA: hypothetical protein ACWV46_005441, partial [Salmonella enterica subsp. enterica serovar Muenchen]
LENFRPLKLVVVCYLSYVSKLLKWRCFQAINYGWEKKQLTREMRRIFDSAFKFNIIRGQLGYRKLLYGKPVF